MDGLRKSKDEIKEEASGSRQSTHNIPLHYQLEEKDSETMILNPTPSTKRNTNSDMAANFAYLSQQMIT